MSSSGIDIGGIGIVSPFGCGREAFWTGLLSGKTQLAALHGPESDAAIRVARVAALRAEACLAHELSSLPRPTQMALLAAAEAWEDAGMTACALDRSRIGVYASSTYGLLDELADFERDLAQRSLKAARPSVYQEITLGALAGHVSIAFDISGPIVPLTQSWLGSLRALELAIGDLRAETIDAALIVAVESLGEAMLSSAREEGLTTNVGEASVALLAARHGAAIGWHEPYARLGTLEFRGSDLETSDVDALSRAILACSPADGLCDGFFGVSGVGARVDEIERAALAKVFGSAEPEVVLIGPLVGNCGSSSPLLNVAAAALCCRKRELPSAHATPGAHAPGAERARSHPRTTVAAAWAPEGRYAALALQAAS